MPHRPHHASRPWLLLCLALGFGLCSSLVIAGGESPPAPASPAKAAPIVKKTDPLVIGTYPLALENIIDGDTIRLPDGLPSVRILGIDAEETFKHDADRKAAAQDFAAYAKLKRGRHARPVKYGTPAGEAAAQFLRTLGKGAARRCAWSGTVSADATRARSAASSRMCSF